MRCSLSGNGSYIPPRGPPFFLVIDGHGMALLMLTLLAVMVAPAIAKGDCIMQLFIMLDDDDIKW